MSERKESKMQSLGFQLRIMLKELKDCYKVQSYPAEVPGFQVWQEGAGSLWHAMLLLPHHSSMPWETCSGMSMGQTVCQIKVLQAGRCFPLAVYMLKCPSIPFSTFPNAACSQAWWSRQTHLGHSCSPLQTSEV